MMTVTSYLCDVALQVVRHKVNEEILKIASPAETVEDVPIYVLQLFQQWMDGDAWWFPTNDSPSGSILPTIKS